MSELVITTYDWVPEWPRGFVRDLRLRWAMEEAGLDYRVETTPFHDRDATHFAKHPFGQTPWLTDGDLCLFESGAILVYLGEMSEVLLPADKAGKAKTLQWLMAALNSIEMATVAWTIFKFSGDEGPSKGREALEGFVDSRLTNLERVLADREWIAAERFTIADIVMSDVLRLVDRFDALADCPASKAYMDRCMARPAFRKAHADQLAHFQDGEA
ncbi:MAG: glutathione S-transferase family protein [Alphaproteobacteria bacterium]|uniref:glutathione S-transferase family protein n=1 Tax=Maricaulis alexandrii TaxID=2570354 RepID=UPI0011099C70|nr:glutathione S-transferase family protein [Alphaproteobacteria bacterium]